MIQRNTENLGLWSYKTPYYTLLFHTYKWDGIKLALTEEQKQLIIHIDRRANQILSNGNNEELLVSLYDIMDNLKKIIEDSSEYEINALCQKYNGFSRFMKFLEKLALGISDGIYLFNRDAPIDVIH